MSDMDTAHPHRQSAFFVLNVWEEKLDGGHVEWRGDLLDVDGNLTLQFSDWPEMVGLIADALYALRPDDRQPGMGKLVSKQDLR